MANDAIVALCFKVFGTLAAVRCEQRPADATLMLTTEGLTRDWAHCFPFTVVHVSNHGTGGEDVFEDVRIDSTQGTGAVQA